LSGPGAEQVAGLVQLTAPTKGPGRQPRNSLREQTMHHWNTAIDVIKGLLDLTAAIISFVAIQSRGKDRDDR
jgi:hypothetical protein